jgi:hypothetical protein
MTARERKQARETIISSITLNLRAHGYSDRILQSMLGTIKEYGKLERMEGIYAAKAAVNNCLKED